VEKLLSRLDADVSVETHVVEGLNAARDTVLLTANGSASAILSGQQTVLNLLSRLCGIATLTREYVREVAGTRVKIRDTRNTAPGMRLLEQYAIRMGGGVHHRAGLFDAIVLRGEHIAAAGGIKAALDQAHSHSSRLMNPAELTAYEATGTMPSDAQGSSLPIQIEVRDTNELSEALSAGADSVLLSATTAQEVKRLVEYARGIRENCVIEISGDIALGDARSYAESGADFLSPHALTTAARWARLSMLVDGLQEK
jgi:nicotinate-nucleotide pyrophosphorylase (carboxylating)